MKYIFPWQQGQWQQWWRVKTENRLPHGILLSGMEGLGKVHFAECVTRALFCSNVTADGAYCNTCHACRLIETNVHPSVRWVRPEKEHGQIKIDQIREVNEFVSQTTLQGQYRVVIIQPANQMNASAANALLKTLEEPAKGALLILISDQSSRLPATILSRCQRISFVPPLHDDALAWLAIQKIDAVLAKTLLPLAYGAPLKVLHYVKDDILATRGALYDALMLLTQKKADPIKSAAPFSSGESLAVIDFILSWVMDLLRLQAGCDAIINQDYAPQLSKITLDPAFLDYVMQLRKEISGGFNLNKQLVLESAFIRWMESASCS
jgi:DNA polymerase III subunit delta'